MQPPTPLLSGLPHLGLPIMPLVDLPRDRRVGVPEEARDRPAVYADRGHVGRDGAAG